MVDGRLVEDRREISNEFNLFFSSVARKMNAKVYSSKPLNSDEILRQNDTFMKYLDQNRRVCSSMFMEECNENEISEIIKGLENNKASDISIPILKKCSGILLEHLSKFFNSFMQHGIFPSILKRGLITPIFKKGDSRCLDNYRPVSTLPIFGKIFEKIIYSRLYNFFSSKNVIYENQLSHISNKENYTIIEDSGTNNIHPIWSPDGKKIAYLSNSDNDFFSQTDLFIYDK